MKNFYFINEQRGGGNPPEPQPKKSNFTKVNITEKDICDGSKEVTEGMRGDIVGYIQTALKTILKLKDEDFIDDRFGENTKKAVVNYQLNNKDKGLTVSGKVDKDTFDLLFKGTSMACTKEDKPTEVKPTELKPTEPKPIKIRKPMKDLDIVSPEKYSVRIGEQVDDISQGIRNLKGIGGYTANKPATNSVAPAQPAANTPAQPEQKTEDPVQILKRVINTGCIDKLKSDIGFELNGRPESQPRKLSNGTYAITGINNSTEEIIRLFSDGTGQRFKVDEDNKPIQGTTETIDWECLDFKKTTSRTDDSTQMTADQAEYVKDMVARGQIQTTKPSDYETNQGKWEWIDLNRMNPTLFKEPNKYFVYRQSGLMGKLKNQYPNVEKVLNQNGWTFDEPDIDTEAYASRRDIRIQFPKYTELFPNGLYIYYTGNTRSTKQRQLVSTLMADIEKSVDSPDGKTCRDAINILWDAKQGYDKKVIYFSGDTELETVRNYVKQCQVKFERNLFRFLGGGAKDKYEELKSKKHGPNGVMKFNLSENLNSLIKKKLISLKEQKENNKIVKNIVENRLRMIVESAKKDKNIGRLSLQFMGELNQLNEQGLVNEDFGENLKNIFGSDLSSMPKTFFENIFDKILTKINMNDSSLKKSLVLMSEKNPLEIVRAFKDCDSMSILIAKSIVEILHNNINSEKNLTGQGLSSVKTLIGQEIKKDEFIQKVKNNIDDLVCQEFAKLTSNAENLISKIKGSSNDDFSGNL